MRANTNRSGALSFGRLADDYQTGRFQVSSAEVEYIRTRAHGEGISARFSRVLEIGAGTGQLTRALVRQPQHLTALEPDATFRGILASLLSEYVSRGSLRILPVKFEEVDDDVEAGSLDEIWSCDAFHWVDPALGYELASRLTTANGKLILLWRFPYAADQQLRRALNSIFHDLSPDLVRDDDFADQLQLLCAEGRTEMSSSGYFRPSVHWWMDRIVPMSPERFASLQLSLGHIANMTPCERQQLRSAILGVVGESSVEVRLLMYVVVGAKT